MIWLVVAPGLRVVQIVERFGIPARTPALDQSIALAGLMIPDHCWACVKIGDIKTKATTPARDFQKALLMKRNPLLNDTTLDSEILNIVALPFDEKEAGAQSGCFVAPKDKEEGRLHSAPFLNLRRIDTPLLPR